MEHAAGDDRGGGRHGGTSNGFVLRDRTEGHATGVWQLYGSRDHATAGWRPQLVLTWG